MSISQADKSQEPTPLRRETARRDGHTARSPDVVQAVVLLIGAAGLLLLGGATVDVLSHLARRQLGDAAWLDADPGLLIEQGRTIAWSLAKTVLPLLGLVWAAAVVANIAQRGASPRLDRLAADVARINPFAGLARIWSLANLFRFSLGVTKLAVIPIVAGVCLYQERSGILSLADLAPSAIAAYLSELALWTMLKIAAALVILAAADYAFAWWKREQDLRMTPEEIREEQRSTQAFRRNAKPSAGG